MHYPPTSFTAVLSTKVVQLYCAWAAQYGAHSHTPSDGSFIAALRHHNPKFIAALRHHKPKLGTYPTRSSAARYAARYAPLSDSVYVCLKLSVHIRCLKLSVHRCECEELSVHSCALQASASASVLSTRGRLPSAARNGAPRTPSAPAMLRSAMLSTRRSRAARDLGLRRNLLGGSVEPSELVELSGCEWI